MEVSITGSGYLSDKIDVLKAEILKGKDFILSAPTGVGKTTAVIELSEQLKDKKIIIAAPTQPLVDNLKAKYSSENIELVCGYGNDFYNRNKSARVVCTTYDTALNFANNTDIIFIDEAHLIAGHGNFRKEVLVWLLSLDCMKVLLSGTPELIEFLPNYNSLSFTKKIAPKYIEIQIREDKAIDTITDIITNRDKSKYTIIRCNNKKTLDKVQNIFRDEIAIDKLYSDKEKILLHNQNEEAVKSIKKGIIPTDRDVLLTTSIIDAGLSLNVNKDVDCFIVSDRGMPNPIDALQLSDRVRANTGYKMKTTIIGSGFGKLTSTAVTLIENQQPSQWIDTLSTAYDWYTELTEQSYLDVLDRYNVKATVTAIKNTYTRSLKISDTSDITIAKNLYQFPIFSSIRREAIKHRREDELCFFDGSTYLKGSKETTQVIRVGEFIKEAFKNYIPIEWFMSDKFSTKNIDNLIKAIGYIKNSNQFKEAACTLLEAVLYSKEDIKISLDKYHNFDKAMKDSFVELNRVVNNNQRIRGKSLKVENVLVSEELEDFIYHIHPSLRSCLQVA